MATAAGSFRRGSRPLEILHAAQSGGALVLLTVAGHTELEWDSIVARMEAKGTPASADDIDAVMAYLAKALPPR